MLWTSLPTEYVHLPTNDQSYLTINTNTVVVLPNESCFNSIVYCWFVKANLKFYPEERKSCEMNSCLLFIMPNAIISYLYSPLLFIFSLWLANSLIIQNFTWFIFYFIHIDTEWYRNILAILSYLRLQFLILSKWKKNFNISCSWL